MSTGALIAVIIVCVLVAVAVAAALAARQAMLRRQFGPEYDRLARQSGTARPAPSWRRASAGSPGSASAR
jgi:protein-S-isoprenylcysteine O-methyltransferase Ste14